MLQVGSLDNAAHVPGGGDIRIYDEKLRFREMASHRTDVGLNGLGSEGCKYRVAYCLTDFN